MYQKRRQIKVKPRATTISGKFQADMEPVDTLAGKELVQRWAENAGLKPILAQTVLTSLEGFILQELSEGRRLDFNLASFYPRLSGALSSRDSDPESDGLYVRGAVKARRALVNGLKRSLDLSWRGSLRTEHSLPYCR